MTFIAIYLTFILLVVITRPVTVLFHELGHGIGALLLTKENVTLYIGSLGAPKQSLLLRLGRLEMFFKYNPFLWNIGLYVPHSKEITINKQIIITILGPLTSLVIGVLSCYFAFVEDVHGSLQLISVFFLGSSFFDFFINIIPRNNPTLLYDGSIVYNDGQQLKQLLKYKTFPSQYTSGVENYNKQDYKKASKEFHEILDNGITEEMVYRLAISSYLQKGLQDSVVYSFRI
ncbi:MAG: hypothetical protein ACJATI_002835 [Halioglobus sp.]|jgi:hypothetical protein